MAAGAFLTDLLAPNARLLRLAAYLRQGIARSIPSGSPSRQGQQARVARHSMAVVSADFSALRSCWLVVGQPLIAAVKGAALVGGTEMVSTPQLSRRFAPSNRSSGITTTKPGKPPRTPSRRCGDRGTPSKASPRSSNGGHRSGKAADRDRALARSGSNVQCGASVRANTGGRAGPLSFPKPAGAVRKSRRCRCRRPARSPRRRAAGRCSRRTGCSGSRRCR